MKLKYVVFALPLIFLLLMTMNVAADANHVITGDTTLSADHIGNIVIAANDVTLDCDGHEVTGLGSGDGILLDGRTGVTIKNCRVSNFKNGIRLKSSFRNVLTGNTSTGEPQKE